MVALIVTGVDISHPDLKNNVWVDPGETAGNEVDDDKNGYVDDVNGWDFFNIWSPIRQFTVRSKQRQQA